MNALELRAIPLFAGLDDAQLRAVSGVIRRRTASPGEAILSEGERSGSLFVLLEGTVDTTKRMGVSALDGNDREAEKVLIRLSSPQVFGEIGLLEEGERTATVRAATTCELGELRRADFERLAAADVALGYTIIRNIALILVSRLRRTDQDVLKLTAALSLALRAR